MGAQRENTGRSRFGRGTSFFKLHKSYPLWMAAPNTLEFSTASVFCLPENIWFRANMMAGLCPNRLRELQS